MFPPLSRFISSVILNDGFLWNLRWSSLGWIPSLAGRLHHRLVNAVLFWILYVKWHSWARTENSVRLDKRVLDKLSWLDLGGCASPEEKKKYKLGFLGKFMIPPACQKFSGDPFKVLRNSLQYSLEERYYHLLHSLYWIGQCIGSRKANWVWLATTACSIGSRGWEVGD